jgi:Tol biopolymer transport system component
MTRASDIFVMNVDGSNVRNVTNDGEWQGDVDWSPDGQQLVYSASVDDNNGGWTLHIISADGSSRRRVSERHMFAVSPSWSPNGQRIAFSGFHDVGSHGSLDGYQSIYTIRTDGTGMRNLFPNNKRGYYSPDWQPGA